MDSFEQIAAMLLARNGYWTRTSYKVCLSKREKARVGLPSTPRWELDVVGYRPRENLLLVVECKSFLNSPGVRYDALSGDDPEGARRYKLFTNAVLRTVVLRRLRKQLVAERLVLPRASVRLCLAAGHICRGDAEKVRRLCKKNRWLLFDCKWFREQFASLAATDYENEVAIVAAKLALTQGG